MSSPADLTPPGLERVEPGPGQTSVWDFPTPPRVAQENRRVRVYVGGIPIVTSTSCLKVLETGHPPTVYIPTQDFKHCEIRRLKHTSTCEFKGLATQFTLIAGGRIAHRAAWGYLNPLGQYRRLMGYLAVHADRVDAAFVGDEQVTPQEGGLHGGWITDDVVGPFKGGPGTEAW